MFVNSEKGEFIMYNKMRLCKKSLPPRRTKMNFYRCHDSSKKLLCAIVLFCALSIFAFTSRLGKQRDSQATSSFPEEPESFVSWRNLSRKQVNSLSVLGRRMFLEEDVGAPQDRNFTILVWHYVNFTEKRLIYRFGDVRVDPFDDCSVHNCHITYEESAAPTADAVYIHFHRTLGPHTFPKRSGPDQVWIWGTDESPVHNFWKAKDKNLKHYSGYFNWSMTFRMDSEIPVPYGRTLRLPDNQTALQPEDVFAMKSKLAAVMMTNCRQSSNDRLPYIRHLQKHMKVDFYGRCGSLKCPGHIRKDCELLEKYKFYLSFENSNCHDYITEKVWWNALEKKAVPVVMGGRAEDYRRMLPPNSFVHVDDYETPEDLAKYLKFLDSNREAYMKYHQWRHQYKIVQEHGYFGAPIYHYCRMCEALNYNARTPTTYNDLEAFWGKKQQCQPPTWPGRLERAARDRKA
ncbi:4-galactosyl-N-acetylglucosaminide 3-alpha-L-fucosyltransferase FUT6-like isoform X1 [Penaeus indicus]|uniref:4-galactosyl-N-acetylglucosaminide 3-alpha-L-fucosyltransferase FUT6-like isoform X1 n=2 Tax=Penaeus indicus TaxID=29960 RepID=UPI00300C1BAD